MTEKGIYTASKIFTGETWLSQQAIITENGIIKDIVSLSSLSSSSHVVQFDQGFIVPAFIDLQIYGAHGKLLAVYPDVSCLKEIADYSGNGGACCCMPTVATNTKAVFFQCIDAVRSYWKNGGDEVLGLHLEGPWLNAVKKGAHVNSLIHAPEVKEVKELLEYGKDVIKMITLAPEVCDEEIIRLIHSENIIISAGHSNATYAEAKKGFNAGITAVTHLFNAMSPFMHREPGLAGAAMDDETVMSSIIPDGYHVDFAAIRIAKKAMKERLFAITDAVTITKGGYYQHMPAGDKYEANGVLSGSALTMKRALQNLVNNAGIETGEAIRMCSLYPARLMKKDEKLGSISPGKKAKMIVLNKSLEIIQRLFLTFIIALFTTCVFAQDQGLQYPPGLKNAYFGVNIGYINYPFTEVQLEPGFQAESISIPHIAVRIVLYGAPINKYLSARITYMRPVGWIEYRNVNGDRTNHSVWMNIAGLTLEGKIPINKKWTFSAEAGLGVITRNGFNINDQPVVKNANYGTGLFGGTIAYHLNKKWDLHLNTAWSPAHSKTRQPATFFLGAGFNYHLTPLSESQLEEKRKAGYYFPKQILFAGYTTNRLGYGVNDFVSKKASIFWGGDAQVRNGFSVMYQRNIFHSRKVFAFDWAAGLGFWTTRRSSQHFFTASLNPVLRFNAFRSRSADIFLEYSVAGPTFISRTVLDSIGTGRKFTFHDFMGLGVFAGKKKNLYAGIRIAHYSNGNIFPQNDGVMIPLTFNVGYALK